MWYQYHTYANLILRYNYDVKRYQKGNANVTYHGIYVVTFFVDIRLKYGITRFITIDR